MKWYDIAGYTNFLTYRFIIFSGCYWNKSRSRMILRYSLLSLNPGSSKKPTDEETKWWITRAMQNRAVSIGGGGGGERERRKSKAKVISLANHNRCKQCNEPIRIQSKYFLAQSAGKRVRASQHWTFCFSLVKKVPRVLLTNHRAY